MKYCNQCGAPVNVTIPTGDNRKRHVCKNPDCGTIHYLNPRIITGCLPVHDNRVLLCKRAIEPRYGYWTLPAGFLENGETTEQGAERESWEEAKTNLNIEHLYRVYNLPHINQIYFFYKAQLTNLDFGAGEESLDVRLFEEHEIPWADLAFPVVIDALKHYFKDQKNQSFEFRSAVITRSHHDL